MISICILIKGCKEVISKTKFLFTTLQNLCINRRSLKIMSTTVYFLLQFWSYIICNFHSSITEGDVASCKVLSWQSMENYRLKISFPPLLNPYCKYLLPANVWGNTNFSLGFMKSLYLKEYKKFPTTFSLVFTGVTLRVCSLFL